MNPVKNIDHGMLFEGGNRKKKGGDSFLEKIGLKGKKNKMIEDNNGVEWHLFNKEQKKLRIKDLWSKARKYTNKIRFFARLQKL